MGLPHGEFWLSFCAALIHGWHSIPQAFVLQPIQCRLHNRLHYRENSAITLLYSEDCDRLHSRLHRERSEAAKVCSNLRIGIELSI